MVDAVVSTVLQQLLSVIQLQAQEEVRLVVGVRDEVQELSGTFKKIQAVLKDAEKKQVKEESVKLWLEDLKDVAYDLEDVLDEWSTIINLMKAQEHEVDDARDPNKKKVCATNLFSPGFCFNQVGLRQRHDIGHKIKKIKKRLDKIASEKDKYHFIQSTNCEMREEELQRPETSSQVDVSKIYGRDLDKDIIISKLLSESSQQEMDSAVSIVSIVGMGGLGKTTLAQFAYNDDKVKNHFQKRVWVCVSEPFDKVKIAKEIIKAISENKADDNDTSWEVLHRQLSDSIEGKHFLLVLDDVWTEDTTEWEPLRLSFSRGARGSRILVTTRNVRVASMMRASYICHLEKLSDQHCWTLLSHIAFTGRKEEECAKLKEIGIKIAKKCQGLPLSAETIGNLLRTKKTKQDWQNVLENDIWELPEVGKFVLPALLLSYNDLPSHLKQCFSYSAVFLKGQYIYRDTVIRMWMAQGFLNNCSMGEMGDLEINGRGYYDILVTRSFFQELPNDEFDVLIQFKMHDLVHDFAQFLMKNECSTMVITKEMCSNARHLSLQWNDEIDSIPSRIYTTKNIRTVHFNPIGSSSIFIFPSELFKHLKCLRELSLRHIALEELPSEVGKLIHLRFIDLSGTSLKELPATLTNLYNLQTLDLRFCERLCKLPKGFGRLINLRHLMLDGCNSLSYLPQGIGRLRALRTITKFIVGGGSVDGGGCKIGELKELNLLQGNINITGLGRVANREEANEAELKNKQRLRYLYLDFDNDDGGDTVEERMESVFEGLQPHPNLEIMEIKHYPCTKLPNWMVRDGDLVFSNLLYFGLSGCKKCKELPPILGKLPFLEELALFKMDEVKYIGNEFSGVVGSGDDNGDVGIETVFPKLKKLILDNMYNLEELFMGIKEVVDGRKIIFMPCLENLVLQDCPKLKALTRHISLSSFILKELFIKDCPYLTWTLPSCCLLLSRIEDLCLWGDAGELSRSLAPNSHICFSNLKSLKIKDPTYSSLPKGLAQLTTLQFLGISNCGSFMSLPEELQYLTMLQQLEIENCPFLEPRCQKEGGEDWSKISHIPFIYVGDRWIQY